MKLPNLLNTYNQRTKSLDQGKRFLGIDYGSKRIGVAVSDPTNVIARGVGVVLNSRTAIAEIKKYASEFDVAAIVVGMPLTLKGTKGQKSVEVEEFIEKLKKEVAVEIATWDERFTSAQAHQTLLDMGVKKKQRQSKERIDEMAAAIMLQAYLDSRKKN